MLDMLSIKHVCDAIQVISEAFCSMGGDPHDGGRLGWSTICTKLQSLGERVSEEELVHCLEVRHRRVHRCVFQDVHVVPLQIQNVRQHRPTITGVVELVVLRRAECCYKDAFVLPFSTERKENPLDFTLSSDPTHPPSISDLLPACRP